MKQLLVDIVLVSYCEMCPPCGSNKCARVFPFMYLFFPYVLLLTSDLQRLIFLQYEGKRSH